MEFPEIQKMFGFIPLRSAINIISIFGFASGGLGLATIIIYGLAEESFLKHIFANENMNDAMKKITLLTFGMTSLLLTIGTAFLMLGGMFAIRGAAIGGYMILFVMVMLIMVGFVAVPMFCFFIRSTCVFLRMDTALLVFIYLVTSIYIMIWMYFISVAWNYAESL